MSFIETRIKWIMLVAGAVTCTMAWAAIAPQAALLSVFGEALDGPLADLVVRSWGALIALIGAMLIYGAFVPEVRAMVLIVAGVSKLVFIALVLSHGGRYIDRQAGLAVAVDLAWVALFAWYLLAARTARGRAQT